jgi:(1->4)-alpha-D-glucan 1-alpha-D-glucosylmutase
VTATYRLQLHAGFTFADAEARVPYLAELGITHLYLSPVLQAAPGSMHGYDVVDHSRVSADLGGEPGLLSLAADARAHGLGLVVDVVPNHMALVAPEHLNAPLWELLTHGPDAATAHWFDVDWAAGDGRLGLAVLGDDPDTLVAAGEITRGEHDGRPVLRYADHVLPMAPGTDVGEIHDILARQHYRLACWRDRDTVLNYRRFFDVDSLVAVRVEDPDVFDATHRLLLDLNHRGVIEGFRIDHPDGLADPEAYLRRLRSGARPGTAIWVEKILEADETLPGSWACDGSTGYDALRLVTAALADPTAAPALTDDWVEAGGNPDLDAVVDECKRLVVATVLVPEQRRLARRAAEALPAADPARLFSALTELLVAGDVYRAYVRPGEPAGAEALDRLERAGTAAAEARPDLVAELDLLTALAAGGHPHPDGGRQAADDFVVRLQQTWGPVMAKGIEDTAFYRWHRLTALNEVGGDPMLVDSAAPEQLHTWAERQQASWALGMTTLSTHDTKRSEDVRARILAVAGDAEAWGRCTAAFAEAADVHGVDRPTAHLIWQTLVGTGDIGSDRLHGYLTKAVREAKQHTAWVDGDAAYEQRVLALAEAARCPGPLQALVRTAVEHNREAIRALVLGQKLLQLSLPGAADSYQGCEVVDLSLVDPDNRRPVDFDAAAARLRALDPGRADDLDDEKLLVTTRALHLRRELRGCFGDEGGYRPLPARTRHLVGFLRGDRVAVAATRAAQRLAAAGGWTDQTLTLPDGSWRDELTGSMHPGGELRCGDLLARRPVALLRRVDL